MLALSAIALIAVAMAARSESRSIYHMGLIRWTSIAFVGLIIFTILQRGLTRGEKTEWSYAIEYLKLSRLLMARVVATAGILIGMTWFVRNRRQEILSRSLLLTAVCAAAAWFLWPVNFVKSFTAEESSAPKNEWPDQSALKFAFEEQKAWSLRAAAPVLTRFSYGDGGYNGTTYRRISGYTRLEGLPYGWVAYPNSYESELTRTNGNTSLSHYEAWAGLSEESALPLVGIPSRRRETTNQLGQVDLAEIPLPDAADATTGAKLKGIV